MTEICEELSNICCVFAVSIFGICNTRDNKKLPYCRL